MMLLLALIVLPQYQVKTCDGQECACYTFEQAKELHKLDLDLQLKLHECEKMAPILNALIERSDAILATSIELEKKNGELATMLSRTTREITTLQTEVKVKWSTIAVVGVAVLGIIAGAVTYYTISSM
jgi:hypothetical protein